MFPREQRIRSGKEIITVLRKGRRSSVEAVSCSFLEKPAKLGRVAVITSTKVSKKAVTRNRLKRQVLAILREYGLPKGDLVIRLDKKAVSVSFDELTSQLQRCLKRY